MAWIPGGLFRMGSGSHDPEEAPSHRASVDGFWIDETPVTHRQFRTFVEATGHLTFAEFAPDAKYRKVALRRIKADPAVREAMAEKQTAVRDH